MAVKPPYDPYDPRNIAPNSPYYRPPTTAAQGSDPTQPNYVKGAPPLARAPAAPTYGPDLAGRLWPAATAGGQYGTAAGAYAPAGRPSGQATGGQPATLGAPQGGGTGFSGYTPAPGWVAPAGGVMGGSQGGDPLPALARSQGITDNPAPFADVPNADRPLANAPEVYYQRSLNSTGGQPVSAGLGDTERIVGDRRAAAAGAPGGVNRNAYTEDLEDPNFLRAAIMRRLAIDPTSRNPGMMRRQRLMPQLFSAFEQARRPVGNLDMMAALDEFANAYNTGDFRGTLRSAGQGLLGAKDLLADMPADELFETLGGADELRNYGLGGGIRERIRQRAIQDLESLFYGAWETGGDGVQPWSFLTTDKAAEPWARRYGLR